MTIREVPSEEKRQSNLMKFNLVDESRTFIKQQMNNLSDIENVLTDSKIVINPPQVVNMSSERNFDNT